MDIKDKIKSLINEAVKTLCAEPLSFSLEHPDIMTHGDYATNVALLLSKQLKKSPVEVAKMIVEKISLTKPGEVAKIEVAGPGFINFYLSNNFFVDSLEEIFKKAEKYGRKKETFFGKFFRTKTIIEHTDPNPFKEFHVGHLMSNSIGESISRIVEANGAKIIPVSYGGDVGLHVAKAMFAVLKHKEEIEVVKKENTKEQLSFWAKLYVEGSTAYEEEPNAKIEVDNLNKIIFNKSDAYINSLYDWGREISIEHFKKLFTRLDTHFVHNFWESEVISDALKIVAEGLEKGILEKSEGAIVFKGEKYGLHTRVFVNSKGVPTYEAKELGLGIKKIELYNFDNSIIITGNEQDDYFKVVLKAIELLRPEVKDKTVHLGHGMLRFASGKMSSRKGNIITGVSLLDQVKENILEKMKDRDMSNSDKEKVAEIVAVSAVKYSILKQAAGSDIIFDFDKSLSFEGDSGPYLQYSCVRAKSILEKAKKEGIKMNPDAGVNLEAGELSKLLIRFGEVVERAGREYSPHYLAIYLTELASSFSTFYAQEKVIDKTNPLSAYRIALVAAFVQVMQNGLKLLGIKVPERM
jgi:arginyl-tRNA synthetase